MSDSKKLYEERLNRYLTALKCEKPDKVPIRLYLGEWAARYAGFTLQEVYYDLDKQYKMVEKVIANWDVDSIRGLGFGLNPPALRDSLELKFYRFPGMDLPEDSSFQYHEEEYMKAEDYDDFIANPTGWIVEKYLPRVSEELSEPGSYRASIALIKGSASMMQYSGKLGELSRQVSEQFGFVQAGKGMTKAPFDTLGDTLRGMKGILTDIRRHPDKLIEACNALVPHNIKYALAGPGADRTFPVMAPLHRGSYPFLSVENWLKFYWPSLKAVIEGLWKQGKSMTFFAEGDWTPYLEHIANLPAKSIQFIIDNTDPGEAKKHLGGKFCLIGAIPTTLFTYGTPSEMEETVKKTIDELGREGGYILDAGGVIMGDAKLENIEAMIEAGRKYGTY
ncbi:MAG: uroporphyrinogen decarboxylase family protein [Bacillota bacterium]|nr:uroporphyrinogen decarboxylase family protein [Bacillota bacterium]